MKWTLALALCAGLAFSASVQAGQPLTHKYEITEENKMFSPPELEIPANQKVKVIVKNLDQTAAEFESSELGREKVIPPYDETFVFIGPLKAGTYSYIDGFHHQSTGKIVAK